MDTRFKAALVGSLVGIVILLVYFAAASLVGEQYYKYIPDISYLSIAAFVSGWYYRKISEVKSVFKQAIPAVISIVIVGLIGFALSLATTVGLDPLLILISAVAIIPSALIYGLFFGVAGYRLKDSKIITLQRGIIGMLMVFSIGILFKAVYSAFISLSYGQIDVASLLVMFLEDLYVNSVNIVLFGLTFTSLFVPFKELLKNKKFVTSHVYSFVFALVALALTLLFFFLGGFMFDVIGLFLILVLASLLIYGLLNGEKLLGPLFKERVVISYSAALVAVLSLSLAITSLFYFIGTGYGADLEFAMMVYLLFSLPFALGTIVGISLFPSLFLSGKPEKLLDGFPKLFLIILAGLILISGLLIVSAPIVSELTEPAHSEIRLELEEGSAVNIDSVAAILQTRLDTLGLDSKLAKESDNKHITIKIYGGNPNDIEQAKSILDQQAFFEQYVDGDLCAAGDEISLDASHGGGALVLEKSWMIYVKLVGDAPARCGQAVENKAGHVTDIFLDRPKDAFIVLDDEMCKELRETDFKNHVDDVGYTQLSFIEERALIPVICYTTEEKVDTILDDLSIVVAGESLSVDDAASEIERLAGAGLSEVIIAKSSNDLPSEITSKVNSLNLNVNEVIRSKNQPLHIAYDVGTGRPDNSKSWIDIVTGLKSTLLINEGLTYGDPIYASVFEGAATSNDEAENIAEEFKIWLTSGNLPVPIRIV